MMFGWSRKLCILSSRMNWTKRLSLMIPFLSIDFSATIMPVYISLARNTLPNLPSPSRFIILKFSLHSCPRFSGSFAFSGDFVWLRKNEGSAFSLRCVVIYGLSLELLFPPPEVLPLKRPSFAKILSLLPRLKALHWPLSSGGLTCFYRGNY